MISKEKNSEMQLKNKKSNLKKSKLKKMLVEKIEKKETSGKIIMLKDNLNDILDVFEMNFITNNGENILK